MKTKYLLTTLLLGYAGSCFSADVLERYNHPENQEYKKEQQEFVKPRRELKLKGITELESQAIRKADTRGLTEKDIEEGIATYRKKIANHPELSGIPFDLFPGGMISFDNYM